jgi:hypothetical protein
MDAELGHCPVGSLVELMNKFLEQVFRPEEEDVSIEICK